MLFMPNNDELNDEELALLDALLLEYATEREDGQHILTLSELDGFLTAVVSTPVMITPSQWLPVIFDQNNPDDFPDKETAEALMSLLFRHYNNVITRLSSRQFYAFFDETEDDFVILDEWCSGYIVGATSFGWGHLPSKIQEYYNVIRKFAFFNGDEIEQNDQPTAEETQQRAAEVEQAAVAIYQHFFKLRR